jgi:DNA segregation ATPase FtsK/SpoIIIE, S-DNA-T family
VEHCLECGFVYAALPRDEIATSLRSVADQYRSRLIGLDGATLRRRPLPDVWSPLEYAAHVRDVLATQRERAALALRSTDPTFPSMRPEALVVERAYNDDDPSAVVARVEFGAELLAALFDGLSEAEWGRGGVYNWPSPARRDLVWIGRHTVHELAHHLLDISRATDPTPSRASG